MKKQNLQQVQLLQPYLEFRTKDYREIIENSEGISHFYEFQLRNGKNCGLQAVQDGSVDLLF